MEENLIKLKHLRQTATEANGRISEVASTAAEAIEEVAEAKQDKLSGLPGQFVGFDANGNAISQAVPSGGGVTLVNAPMGAIMAWSGTEADVPEGWHICNGEDGTPDFRDKFLLGAGPDHELGSEGGEAKHALIHDEMPRHYHNVPSIDTSGSNNIRYNIGASLGIANTGMVKTSERGAGIPHNNMPPYYAVLWIMKMIDAEPTGIEVYLVKAPVGVIVTWSGTEDQVPDGWHICDGTSGTLDLRDKFILGAGENHSVGEIGGAESVALAMEEMPRHTHNVYRDDANADRESSHIYLEGYSVGKNYSASPLSGPAGGNPDSPHETAAHNNMPPYYALIYIQKISPDETDIPFITDDTMTMDDGVLSVKTPIIPLTRSEYDSLPEEEKMTDALYIVPSAMQSNSNDNLYSTEETMIGIWVYEDGTRKPIYRKRLSFTSTTNSNGAKIDGIENVDIMVNAYGGCYANYSTSGYCYAIPGDAVHITVGQDHCFHNIPMDSTFRSKQCYCVFEYTKTTDEGVT